MTTLTLDPGDPKIYGAARRSKHWDEWKKDIIEEYNNITTKGVWRKLN